MENAIKKHHTENNHKNVEENEDTKMRRGAEEEEMEGKIKAAKKPLRKVGGGGNVDLNGTQKVSHGTRRQTHAHTQYTHAHIYTRHTDSQRDVGQMDGQLFKLRSFIPLR